ncbi:MAG: TIM barrel protein [Chloroflexota bacterium]
MEGLVFGPAGVPVSAKKRSSVGGIERVRELGLGAMELEFVQGVRMGEKEAGLVRQAAEANGVRLTVHGPYYINLNSQDPEKLAASRQRICQSARIGAICGAESVTFHAAFYQGIDPKTVYNTVLEQLREIRTILDVEDNHLWIRPELTGKESQFGSLDELLNLSTAVPGVMPCVDFAHYHARTGRYNSYAEFAEILQRVEARLGRRGLENMHIHVSGIAYSPKGERNHLNLAEADLKYQELIQTLKDFQVRGFVICESPNLEEDALLLQETYHRLS